MDTLVHKRQIKVVSEWARNLTPCYSSSKSKATVTWDRQAHANTLHLVSSLSASVFSSDAYPPHHSNAFSSNLMSLPLTIG